MIDAYFEHRQTLLRYFEARTRDRALAEEIVQELYVKVAELPGAYRVEHEMAFLFRLAQNIWLNHLRARNRRTARDQLWQDQQTHRIGAEAVVDTPSAEERLAARQELARLQRALDGLPERARRIFQLHKLEGLNQNEVAARLGVSRSLVEKELSAALRALMAALKREGPA